MQTSKSSLVATAVLALTAALPLAGHAQGTVSQHTAWLSNLRYELIDLDPADGIAPGIVFNSKLGVTDVFNGPADFKAVASDALLPSDPVGLSERRDAGEISYAATSDSITVTSRITAQDIIKAYATPIPDVMGVPTGHADVGMQVGLIHSEAFFDDSFRFAEFTLTPHTSLVIKGAAGYESLLDIAPLEGWVAEQGLTDVRLAEHLHAASNVGVYFLELAPDGSPLPPEGGLELGSYSTLGQLMQGDAARSQADTRGFVSTFLNTGETDRSGTLFLGVLTNAAVSLSAFPPAPTPVPEPSGLALMGVGLAALGFAARRHSPR